MSIPNEVSQVLMACQATVNQHSWRVVYDETAMQCTFDADRVHHVIVPLSMIMHSSTAQVARFVLHRYIDLLLIQQGYAPS